MTERIAGSKAFRINADNTYEVFEFNEDNFLDTGQGIVGGLLESVSLPKLGMTMWVNEEGILLDLPINPTASAILQFAYKPAQTVPICGNTFFTSIETDAEGKIIGLSEETATSLLMLMKEGEKRESGN